MRRLRAEAGLTLDDIVAETKISHAILENLESGNFRFLPQKVFCRNFVAQYANVVGGDPGLLVKAFEDAWARFELASGSFPDIVVEDAPLVGTVRWRFWGPVAAAAAILVAPKANTSQKIEELAENVCNIKRKSGLSVDSVINKFMKKAK